MSTWLALGLLITAGLILVLSHDQGTIAGMDPAMFASLMASLALLIWIGSSTLHGYAGRTGQAIKDIITWAGIILILVTLYTFRIELVEGLDRVVHQLLPAGSNMSISPFSKDKATVRIRKKSDGHFVVKTLTSNHPVVMLVDTGASSVILSARDARSIGIPPESLNYNIPINTVAGRTVAARIILDQISIGPIKLRAVDALVAKEGELNESLLGMSFLNRLRSYEVTGDFLILRS